MSKRATAIAFALLASAAALSPADFTIWGDGNNPGKGVNDENIGARMAGFDEAIENATTDEEKLTTYWRFIRDVESRVRNPGNQTYILKAVDEALALNPVGQMKIDILIHGASSTQKTLDKLYGEDLLRARKLSATYRARAMEASAESIKELEQSVKARERHLAERYPGFKREMLESRDSLQRAPWLPELDAEGFRDLENELSIIKGKIGEIESLERGLERTPGMIAHLYSATAPYDLEEVKEILNEFVSEEAAREGVVERTREGIRYAIAKNSLRLELRVCDVCESVQRVELIDAPDDFEESDLLEKEESGWAWRFSYLFKGENYLNCDHRWRDFTNSSAHPDQIKIGQVVLVRKRNQVGAFRFVALPYVYAELEPGKRTVRENGGRFEWRVGTDAEGGLDVTDPGVRGSEGAKEILEVSPSEQYVIFDQFQIRWTRSGDEYAIYYSKDFLDTLTPLDLAICVTGALAFEDVRPLDARWVYKRSRFDGL